MSATRPCPERVGTEAPPGVTIHEFDLVGKGHWASPVRGPIAEYRSLLADSGFDAVLLEGWENAFSELAFGGRGPKLVLCSYGTSSRLMYPGLKGVVRRAVSDQVRVVSPPRTGSARPRRVPHSKHRTHKASRCAEGGRDGPSQDVGHPERNGPRGTRRCGDRFPGALRRRRRAAWCCASRITLGSRASKGLRSSSPRAASGTRPSSSSG